MKSKAKALPSTAPEAIDITFDFTKVDLFDLMEVLEFSAEIGAAEKAGEEKPNDPLKFAKFLRVLRTAYVRSSRPLNGEDFKLLTGSFWEQYKLVRDPNS